MFQGLRTIVYPVTDVDEGKAWYTTLIGHGPYFDQPFYVGFNIGGFELGLVPEEKRVDSEQVVAITYWGVPDISAAYRRMMSLGAAVHAEIQDVGDGIKLASFFDPFGNVIGIIENPHFRVEAP